MKESFKHPTGVISDKTSPTAPKPWTLAWHAVAVIDECCGLLQNDTLLDSGGAKPSYSLRTVTRMLEYARAALPTYGLQRALYDGAAMAFLTQLHPSSAPVMEALLQRHLLATTKPKEIRVTSCCTHPANFAIIEYLRKIEQYVNTCSMLGHSPNGSAPLLVL